MPRQLDDETWLHKGWDWLEGHADHDPRPEQYDWLEAEWLRRLKLYEEAYRLVTMDVPRDGSLLRPRPTGGKSDGKPARADRSHASSARTHEQASF